MSNFITILFVLAVLSTATAGIVPSGMVEVSIESKEIAFHLGSKSYMRCIDTIDILVASENQEFSGANLKTGLRGAGLAITDILPGDFIDSCKWEYFETRQPISPESDSLNLWQITTLSELLPDSTRPLCYRPDGQAVLARIVVEGTVTALPDSAFEIVFYWEDCPDNTLSDKTGNKLFVSDNVLNLPQNITTDSISFPTFIGTPASCINDRNPNRPLRRVIFKNGILTPVYLLECPPVEDSTDN